MFKFTREWAEGMIAEALVARGVPEDEARQMADREALMIVLAQADGQVLAGFDLGHTLEVMYGGQADAILAAGWRPSPPVPADVRDALRRDLMLGLGLTGPNYENVPVNSCPDDDQPGEPRPMKSVPVNNMGPLADFLIDRGWRPSPPVASEDEREALANLIPLDLVHDRGRPGFPQNAFEAADRIFAAGFSRRPLPSREGIAQELYALMAGTPAEPWIGTATDAVLALLAGGDER